MGAYILPTFNLSANVWHGKTQADAPAGLGAPDLTTDCNLQFGKKAASGSGQEMWLLVPKLTDIRDGMFFPFDTFDVVECPAGSGRWYTLYMVDDVAKGFPNEYRAGAMLKASWAFSANADWAWATPYP